jgi:hypothetical protein
LDEGLVRLIQQFLQARIQRPSIEPAHAVWTVHSENSSVIGPGTVRQIVSDRSKVLSRHCGAFDLAELRRDHPITSGTVVRMR